MSARAGYYLVVEGGDGSGKSTQVEMLRDYLSNLGHTVTIVNEPGGTDFGIRLRELFKSSVRDTSAITQMHLILAAKHDLMTNIITPALERGEVVISDRGLMSLYVYQGYLGGIPVEQLERAIGVSDHGWPKWLEQPDDEIYLSCNYMEAYRRSSKRGSATDFDPVNISEAQTMARHYDDAHHYTAAPGFAFDRPTNVHMVDTSTLSPSDVHVELRNIVDRSVLNGP